MKSISDNDVRSRMRDLDQRITKQYGGKSSATTLFEIEGVRCLIASVNDPGGWRILVFVGNSDYRMDNVPTGYVAAVVEFIPAFVKELEENVDSYARRISAIDRVLDKVEAALDGSG